MHCKIDTKTLVQIAEDAARRVYSEGQKVENERLRAIARKVCQELLLVEYEKREATSQESYGGVGEKWTINEDNILRTELAAFFTATSRKHKRSRGAIVSRVKQFYTREY